VPVAREEHFTRQVFAGQQNMGHQGTTGAALVGGAQTFNAGHYTNTQVVGAPQTFNAGNFTKVY